jgi:endonuclease/exonuclease/phosphatase family metal-dependent hydrolase
VYRIPLLLTCAALAAVAACPTIAAASTPTPAAPTGARLTSATSTSLTVTARSAAHATGYRLFASTRRSDVYVANIAHAKASSVYRTPRMTIGGLRYTTATYYYRVEALNGSRRRFDATIHAGGLRPARPGGLQLHNGGTGTWLTWNAVSATGYAVEVATNAAMTAGRHVYAVRDLTTRFTPYGLAKGTAYWFRVRAVTHGTGSAWSSAVSGRVSTTRTSFTVMTYNLLSLTFDGTKINGTAVAPWSKRRAGVVQLIEQGSPDILCVQEAASFVSGRTRQVDDLVRALGGRYKLARTEVPPTEPGWMRTGLYVLYKPGSFSFVSGAHWEIGNGRWAAYARLRSRTTGAVVLVVNPHLFGGSGRSYDARRQTETASMVKQASGYASSHGSIPVVYAGDFNSNTSRSHVFDGAGAAMRSARVLDAKDVAVHLYNASYNSANQYLRTPARAGDNIDYVFAGAGVGVLSWGIVLHLVGGRFPGVIPSDHNPVQARLDIRT